MWFIFQSPFSCPVPPNAVLTARAISEDSVASSPRPIVQ